MPRTHRVVANILLNELCTGMSRAGVSRGQGGRCVCHLSRSPTGQCRPSHCRALSPKPLDDLLVLLGNEMADVAATITGEIDQESMLRRHCIGMRPLQTLPVALAIPNCAKKDRQFSHRCENHTSAAARRALRT